MGQHSSKTKKTAHFNDTHNRSAHNRSAHNRSSHSRNKGNYNHKNKAHSSSSHLRQSSSGLVGNQSERESLAAWVREGINVTEVYNIHQIVGHGHLGVISVVTRKRKETAFSQHHRTHSSNSIRSSPHFSQRTRKFSNDSISSSPRPSLHWKTSDESSDQEPVSGRPRLNTGASERSLRERVYACKTVSTARMQPGQMEELLNEVRIMRDLDHPHILHLFEVYYVKRRMWLIMELCTGGDLFRRIDTNTELDICLVMEQICRAVVYMHRRGVCHHDIKLENVLYEHEGSDADIKLIDFGLSQKFTRSKKMLRACGTVYSVAPELVEGGGYTEMSDIWSIGCVAFILLSGGTFPFLTDHESLFDEAKKERLIEAEYVFGPEWDERRISSKGGREFVGCCLRKDPGKRLSARELLDFLRTEWEPVLEESDIDSELSASIESGSRKSSSSELKESAHVESDLSKSSRRSVRRRDTKVGSVTLQGMKEFSLYGQLKKRVLMIMAHTMDKSSLGELSDLFIAMDTEGTGTISIEEMRDAVQKMYDEKNLLEFTEQDIENMFKGIDQDRSGQIHYAEFLAAVLESQGLITMELLGEAFDRIDTEGKGYISKEDLRVILGRDYDEDLVNRMMEEADYKKNGQVDYDEFLNAMFEDPADGMEMISMENVSDSFRTKDSLEWIG